jgi:hypothetical protein
VKNLLTPLFVSALAFAAFAMLGQVPAALAEQKPFKIQIEQTDRLHGPGTQLNRNDIRQKTQSDPFSGDDDEALDAAPGAFQAEKPLLPPKSKPLSAGVQQNMRQAPMVPNDLGGQPDAMPMQVQQPPPPAFDPNDPDGSPDMQLAWDAWHRRVAGVIYDRFNFFAKAAFKHSAPLLAGLSYQVTRDGHIINMNMTQKSKNILFNVLVYQSVKSLEGDMSVLTFPQGSRRMFVAKMGTFTQNYGQEGFKYQTGDQERIRAQQMQQQQMQGMRPAFR